MAISLYILWWAPRIDAASLVAALRAVISVTWFRPALSWPNARLRHISGNVWSKNSEHRAAKRSADERYRRLSQRRPFQANRKCDKSKKESSWKSIRNYQKSRNCCKYASESKAAQGFLVVVLRWYFKLARN